MYTRVVTLHIKPEHRDKVNSLVNTQVMPILTRQQGFVDFVALTPENDDVRSMAVSFWNSKADADRYAAKDYPTVLDILKPYLTKTAEVIPCMVEVSTMHKIAAGKAA